MVVKQFRRTLQFRTYSLITNQFSNMRKSVFYEAAINTLNNLQSNWQYINSTSSSNRNDDQLSVVKKYCERVGLDQNKLNGLSVIHVAGTKGKGSTCAFSESILRQHGLKTGFFSSPHLIEVRERIRINGKPIEKDHFAKKFWTIYNQLNQQKDDDSDMPLYFRFLTIMAFSIFVEEKVDVAIIEVGIGGEYDCTNILKNVPVIGISSLGMDHTSILGNSLESIAWNKAGIMKKGCKAFTVHQPEKAMNVLKQRSIEKQCNLTVVEGKLNFDCPQNGYPTNIFNMNASLAVALCSAWISSAQNNDNRKRLCDALIKTAIMNCSWPGRYHIKQCKNIRYYLDGAHTAESMRVCAEWFKEITKESKHYKALLFNVTGNRNVEKLLIELLHCQFDTVLFVPNIAKTLHTADNTYTPSNIDWQVKQCEQYKNVWMKMQERDIVKISKCVKVLPSIEDAIQCLGENSDYELLVTGSIHLVGDTLSLLDPALNNSL